MSEDSRPSLAGAKRSAPTDSRGNPNAPKAARLEGTGRDSCELVKGAWSADEDENMKKAVDLYGTDWKKVSEMVVGRTSKQCRDRYKLKLDPSINHGPWTPEEDDLLVKLQEQLGNQWTKIAKQMPGRTENSVKSRFASLERSRNREWTEEEDMILRSCQSQNLDFQHISDRYLTKRSEHAIRKRWEKLYMRDLAKKIREELPSKSGMNSRFSTSDEGTEPSSLPPLSMSAPPTFPSSGPNTQIPNLRGFVSDMSLPPTIMPPPSNSNLTSAIDNLLSSNSPVMQPPLMPTIKNESLGTTSLFGSDLPDIGSRNFASNRSGNIKRQSTSVTVLQQILGEPLKNL